MSGSNIWDQVLARIETKVNRHSFYTWFKPTAFVAEREGTIRVRVPNALFRDWLTKHYGAVIDEALAEVQRPAAPIAFVTEDVGVPKMPPKGTSSASSVRATPSTRSSSGRRTSLLMRRAARSPRPRPARTIRCSSTATSVSARRT